MPDRRVHSICYLDERRIGRIHYVKPPMHGFHSSDIVLRRAAFQENCTIHAAKDPSVPIIFMQKDELTCSRKLLIGHHRVDTRKSLTRQQALLQIKSSLAEKNQPQSASMSI